MKWLKFAVGLVCFSTSAVSFAEDWLWQKQWTGTLAAMSSNFVSSSLRGGHQVIYVSSGERPFYCRLVKDLGRGDDGNPSLRTVSPDNPSLGTWSSERCNVRYTPAADVDVVLLVMNISDRTTLASIAYGQVR